MSATQTNREIAIQTPLGEDVLLLKSLVLEEEISRPFTASLELQSEGAPIDWRKILGQNVSIRIALDEKNVRWINGVMLAFSHTGSLRGLNTYKAEVGPWFSLLSSSATCRIFHQLSVPDVIKQVFSDAGFSDYRLALSGSYVVKGICVQYRESHMNFVSRLLEQEGISYYFEHEQGKHTMVLCDGPSAHTPAEGFSLIPYLPEEDGPVEFDHMRAWGMETQVLPSRVVLNDYDYLIPRVDQSSISEVSRQYTNASGEVYEPSAGYEIPTQGAKYAEIRLQELQCRQVIYRGSAFCSGLTAGRTFTLTNSPYRDAGAEIQLGTSKYLIATTRMEIHAQDFSTELAVSGPRIHRVDLTAIPAATVFRPARITPKPVIAGAQTAVVTGPVGTDPKQPFTTSLGSVKVKFRWDRRSQEDENSSGWIRVAQISAGPGWGSMFVPRIGNEVLVVFEEGDPDRPVIVGSLYNANNLPPLGLPQFSRRCYISDDGGNAIAWTPETGSQSLSLYSPHKDTLYVVGASYDAEISDPTSPI